MIAKFARLEFELFTKPSTLDFLRVHQLSGFSEREMNNPMALCELAARAPNISAGHMVKKA